MPPPLERHQIEIRRNLDAWNRKPALRAAYADFYQRLLNHLDPQVPGRIVEIGSGIGNLRKHLPGAVCTDLFPNPWLDLVCDGYDLPFRAHTLSHLVLIDVFHHLEAPQAFLAEAERVLRPGGRLLLFEPYISLLSHGVYGLLHHEPVAWTQPISLARELPRPRHYYAAQGNATRLFFRSLRTPWLTAWSVTHREAFAGFTYLASGGFSGPNVAHRRLLPWLQRLDAFASRWPRLFGIRCLVVLRLRSNPVESRPP